LLAVAVLVAWYAFRPERLVVNRQVDEAMPAAPAARRHSLWNPDSSTAFCTDGRCRNYLPDGRWTHVLRLTSFKTSNGPDVHVYMVAADDAKDVATVQNAGFVDLGVIKGNIGDQNLHAWQRLGLAKFRAVVDMVQTIQREFRSCGAKIDRASQNH